jgi:hypothetical protein
MCQQILKENTSSVLSHSTMFPLPNFLFLTYSLCLFVIALYSFVSLYFFSPSSYMHLCYCNTVFVVVLFSFDRFVLKDTSLMNSTTKVPPPLLSFFLSLSSLGSKYISLHYNHYPCIFLPCI